MPKKISNKNLERSMEIDIASLQTSIGYIFKNKQLLRTAVTHASIMPYYENNKKDDTGDTNEYYRYYEQLEFLGDRVLGLVISHMLYDLFPRESEGDWAKRHTEAVREYTLAMMAKKLCLGDYMLLSGGEDRSGGRQKEALLSDVMEAVIAAIYLDSDFERAKDFIVEHWTEVLERDKTPPEDSKTQLQEWLQARGKPLPEYILVSRSGPDHAPIFEVSITIDGMEKLTVKASSKRNAEKKAAKLLLEKINES